MGHEMGEEEEWVMRWERRRDDVMSWKREGEWVMRWEKWGEGRGRLYFFSLFNCSYLKNVLAFSYNV